MGGGTALLLAAAESLTEMELDEHSGLPGWTRRHLLAHIAANADALLNLVAWARTGVETPMYTSPGKRAEDIEAGSELTASELVAWLRRSAQTLEPKMSELTPAQWNTMIVTAQGRTVPATETAWMRDRELFVHTVDLASGVKFADLPLNFLMALRDDIVAKRGKVPEARGTLPDVTAWLAGRPYDDVTLTDGSPAARLGPWL